MCHGLERGSKMVSGESETVKLTLLDPLSVLSLSEGLKKSLTLEAWEEMMWPISSYHHLEDGPAGGAQPLLCQID